MPLPSTSSSPLALTVPLTQNTAPVHEFNCLYSHDIRRKQKRWQDGFLKYHTFNRRIMVYDVPRNFIGDMHWLREEELQEGDELKLEKGGALVQVADRVGRSETDLAGVMRKKRKVDETEGRVRGGERREVNRGKSLSKLLGAPNGNVRRRDREGLGRRVESGTRDRPVEVSGERVEKRGYEWRDSPRRRDEEERRKRNPVVESPRGVARAKEDERGLRAEVVDLEALDGKRSEDDVGVGDTPVAKRSHDVRAGKTLRLAGSAPRKKTLLCHDQLFTGPQLAQDATASIETQSRHFASRKDRSGPGSVTGPMTLAQRLEKIDKKQGSTARNPPSPVRPVVVDLDADIQDHAKQIEDDTNFEDLLLSSQDEKEFEAAMCDDILEAVPATPPPQTSRMSQAREVITNASSPGVPREPPDRYQTASPPSQQEILVESSPAPEKAPSIGRETSNKSALSPKAVHRAQPPQTARAITKSIKRKFSDRVATAKSTAMANIRNPAEHAKASQSPKAQPASKHALHCSGPWSREAFDLFTWRPPDWDEENWCVKGS